MIWINGIRQSDDGPHVSARDRGFTLADGLFETMRAQGGMVFRLTRHLARLRHGLERLAIPEPAGLEAAIGRALAAWTQPAAAIRLTVTRGTGPAGLAPPMDVSPTVVVALAPMPAFPRAIYDLGLQAVVAAGRRNEYALTAGLKTTAYTDAVVALADATRAGAAEAIFLDTEGHCSEATASNLFIWSGRTLLTPPRSCGALPGITREAVLDLAATFGVPADERTFGLDELLGAGEAFLTSSLRGLAPLVRVDATAIGGGVPGPLTRQLMAAWQALVERECRP
jgi:branched-chain amino acid aminotransferase